MALAAARWVAPRVIHNVDRSSMTVEQLESETEAETVLPASGRVAISLFGGRHHAGHAHASGFCYVNDCVLAVLELQRLLQRAFDAEADAQLASNPLATIDGHGEPTQQQQ